MSSFFKHHLFKFKLLKSYLRVLEVESPLVVCVVADGQKLSQTYLLPFSLQVRTAPSLNSQFFITP